MNAKITAVMPMLPPAPSSDPATTSVAPLKRGAQTLERQLDQQNVLIGQSNSRDLDAAPTSQLPTGEAADVAHDLPSDAVPSRLAQLPAAVSLAKSAAPASTNADIFSAACMEALRVDQQAGGATAVKNYTNSFKSPTLAKGVNDFVDSNKGAIQAAQVDDSGNFGSDLLQQARSAFDNLGSAAAPAAAAPASVAKPSLKQNEAARSPILDASGNFSPAAAGRLVQLSTFGGIAGINHSSVPDAQGTLAGSNARLNDSQWANTGVALLAMKHNRSPDYQPALDAIGKLYGAAAQTAMTNNVNTAPFQNVGGAWRPAGTSVEQNKVVSGSEMAKWFAGTHTMPPKPTNGKTAAANYAAAAAADAQTMQQISLEAATFPKGHAYAADIAAVLHKTAPELQNNSQPTATQLTSFAYTLSQLQPLMKMQIAGPGVNVPALATYLTQAIDSIYPQIGGKKSMSDAMHSLAFNAIQSVGLDNGAPTTGGMVIPTLLSTSDRAAVYQTMESNIPSMLKDAGYLGKK